MSNSSKTWTRLTGGALVLALVSLVTVARATDDTTTPTRTPGLPPSAERTRAGIVSASHPLAAEAGALILRQGGNAIDAAAAIQFALNVVEPEFTGIGGGGFMMIHLADSGRTFIVDSREEATAAATPDQFGTLTFEQASTSGISVGVPGTLRGVSTALRRWGTKPLATVLQPAIHLAQKGFKVNAVLASDIVSSRGPYVMTDLQPETRAVFRPNGTPLKAGDLLVQADLAKTFQLIARHGPKVFYEGEIAKAIVDAQKRAGPAGAPGRMMLEDLARYRAKIRHPIIGEYRGTTIASMSPPSSGGLTIVQMIEMLKRFPLGDASQGFGFGAKNTLHVMIEAMRLAFADRSAWMGDEDFVYVPKHGLLDAEYVKERSALISLESRIPGAAPVGNPFKFDPGPKHACPVRPKMSAPPQEGVHTTHFSVVDRWGNVVSYTTTIESVFGSGILVPGYGFMLNNELTDFNMTPHAGSVIAGTDPDLPKDPGANDVAPRKRPRSSMSPTMLFRHGEPLAAYGSPGGATIINTVFQITLNLLAHGMTIRQAIDAPRISVTSATGAVTCEGATVGPFNFKPTPQFSDSVLADLRALGHNIPPTCAATIGSAQAVIIDLRTGKRYGGADPRREGSVITVSAPSDSHPDACDGGKPSRRGGGGDGKGASNERHDDGEPCGDD